MDYAKTASEILKLCKGSANISSVTHCATRLRLFIINKQNVDVEQIKKIKGVLGTVFSGDELQVILGKELIPVYKEVLTAYEAGEGTVRKTKNADNQVDKEKTTGKVSVKELGGRLIGFVSASVTPMIPGLVAGGMLKTILLLIIH